MTKAELRVLERVFECEISGRRFQARSKLIDKLVDDGLLVRQTERTQTRIGTFTADWLDLTQLGRLTYCMTCGDDDEAKGGE